MSRRKDRTPPAQGICEDTVAYLDNASTSPMHPCAIEAVEDAMAHAWGNPSSQHMLGRKAKEILEKSRETIAEAIGAEPDEVFFTSGGTESNNLALVGACSASAREEGAGTVVATALEHPSVTKTVRGLKREGWSAVYLGARNGCLDVRELEKALRAPSLVRLVSVMSVQSELGYRFPVADIASICHNAAGPECPAPVVHTDAVQAFGKIPIDVTDLGVDMMSFCAHKVGGPKGVGALYVKRGTKLFTTAFGGGQERGLRSGTEAVPLIAGFAAAAKIACGNQRAAYAKACSLRDRLIRELRHRYADVSFNSRDDGSPFIVNFTLPGYDNRKVLGRLSDTGVFLSASTACSSNRSTVEPGTWREKHPLALQLAGVPARLTRSTYRVSFCDRTTIAEIDAFIKRLEEVVPADRQKRTA